MTEEDIAFNNFPNAVSKKEFEAVLSLCKIQYKRTKELIEKRHKFFDDIQNKFAASSDQLPNDEKSIANLKRIVDALVSKADLEMYNVIKDELNSIYDITEFLMRFSESGEYEHLDLSFIKEIKKKQQNGNIQ